MSQNFELVVEAAADIMDCDLNCPMSLEDQAALLAWFKERYEGVFSND